MKNTLITLSFISIGILSFHAQSNRYDWGIEGGPNLSTFKDQPSFDPDIKVFFSGGVTFQYNSPKIFSLRTGLYYQKKGFQQEIKDIGTFGKVYSSTIISSEYHYLTLPVLARATFGKKVKLFVNAGPYVSYLIAQKNTSNLANMPVAMYNNKKYNGIKDWDLGAATGIGIAVPVKSWLVSLEVRNYYGLLNTRIPNSTNSKRFTNTTDLNIGVAYRLGFRDN
jgi:hypothetical protein